MKMRQLFYNESVVVIGVSEAVDNLGKVILGNMVNLGYRGRIFAVGPHGNKVMGYPIYRSVVEVPEVPDLAVILTPARFIPEILVQCGEKGIPWVVIESGGFRELGPEADELERQILEICNRYGIHFVGPNCVGVIHTVPGLYTPFVAMPAAYNQGRVSVFAQSGGVGLSVCERLSGAGIGVNKFVSMGNKLDLDETAYLSFALEDPDTSIIYFYLEDFKQGRAFAEAAKKSTKPIILHKSNTSPLSSVIAQSHTAALAGDDTAVDAICREAGIIRVHSCEQAMKVIRGLSMPGLRGPNIAVISKSGGHAVVVADACARYGFQLPSFDERVLDRVRQKVRAGVIRLGNPLDLGDLYDLPTCLEATESILQQEYIDGIVFIHVWYALTDDGSSRSVIEHLWELAERYDKPIAVVVEGPFNAKLNLQSSLNRPSFFDPVVAVEALSIQWEYAKSRKKPIPGSPPVVDISRREEIEAWMRTIEGEKRQPLLHEAMELLDLIDVPSAAWAMTTTLPDALEAVQHLGYPLALKAVAPSLLHKSEKGAIALNVKGPDELERVWHRLSRLTDDAVGVMLQKMVSSSREMIVGGKRDPDFGPIVLVGLGGIAVEVLKDVSMRLAPVSMDSAVEMIEELSGRRILGAFRGMRAADLKSIAKAVVQVSLLMNRFPQIQELDINPLSLDDEGKDVRALDARVVVKLGSQEAGTALDPHFSDLQDK